MFKFLILLALSLSCGSSHSELKIIGGKKVGFIKELSLSTVGIFQNSGTQHCSGTLIKKTKLSPLLTASKGFHPKIITYFLKMVSFQKNIERKSIIIFYRRK